jgi:pimeloyl-ACP methyl ester carboxylesterase
MTMINGIDLRYDDSGTGEPVVLVMGTGSGGRAWHLHQVPALTAASYRVVTFDNRGTAPWSGTAFTLDDLVADVAALVGHLGLGPCRFVGTSLGSYVVQELALARPELVRQAVLLATKGRSDLMRTRQTVAEKELYDAGIVLPPRYEALVQATQSLSPRTLNSEQAAADWLDIIELTTGRSEGARAQLDLEPMPDRLAAYRAIEVPCHVIAFEDDLITPAFLGREVADAIPGASYEVVPDCGHFGYLEDPVSVNKSIVEFFRAASS